MTNEAEDTKNSILDGSLDQNILNTAVHMCTVHHNSSLKFFKWLKFENKVDHYLGVS